MDLFDLLASRDSERERIEAQARKKKEYHKVGSQRKVAGHTLFSYNTVTGEIKVAEMKVSDTIDFWTRQPLFPSRVIVEKDCIYRQSLNKKNLIRHLKEEGYKLFN